MSDNYITSDLFTIDISEHKISQVLITLSKRECHKTFVNNCLIFPSESNLCTVESRSTRLLGTGVLPWDV